MAASENDRRTRIAALALAVIAVALYQAGMQVARRDASLDGSLLFIARFAQVGAYIVILALFRDHLPSVRTLLGVAAALLLASCAGSAIGPLLPASPGSEVASVATQLCSGFAIGISYLLFWHFMSTYEKHAAAVALIASQVMREIIYGSSAAWGQGAIFWMQIIGRIAGLALFTAALALKERHPYPGDHPMQYGFVSQDRAQDHPLGFLRNNAELIFQLAVALLLQSVFGFTSMMLSDPGMQNGHHDLVSEGFAVLLLAALLVGVWSKRVTLTFNLFFTSTMGLFAAGLLLLPPLWQAGSAFSSCLIRGGVAVHEAILFAMLVQRAHENPRRSYLYFASFGTFANVNYARLLEPALMGGRPLTETLLYEVCSTFLFLMLALCLVLFVLQRTRFTVQSAPTATASTDDSDVAFARNIEGICDESRLTPREREVLLEILHGYTEANVAKRLGISPGTVRTHVKSIYNKTGAANKQDLIRIIDSRA